VASEVNGTQTGFHSRLASFLRSCSSSLILPGGNGPGALAGTEQSGYF
jgi:hypothetical protein